MVAKSLKGEWPEKDEILLPDYVVLSIVKLHFLVGGHQFFLDPQYKTSSQYMMIVK